MAISDLDVKLEFTGNGSNKSFPLNLQFMDYTSDIYVYIRNEVALPHVVTRLALTTDFTFVGSPVPTSILTVAAYPSTTKVLIVRITPNLQPYEYANGDSFPAEQHENALDNLSVQVQELNNAIGRSIVLPITSAAVTLTLPVPVANQALGWNAAANTLVNLVVETPAVVAIMQAEIDALEVRAGNIEAEQITQNGDIDDLETYQGVATGQIGTLQVKVTTLEGEMLTAKSDISTLYGQTAAAAINIGNLQGDVSDLQTDLGVAQGDIISLDGRLDTAETDINNAEIAIGNLQTDLSTLTLDELSDVVLGTPIEGQVLTYDDGTSKWIPGPAAALPSQTGKNGKYLKTDGSVATWEAVDALPSQTGAVGKLLTTDGSVASWVDKSSSFIRTVADVTAAELLTNIGSNLIYIESKEGIYSYCSDCGYTADSDLVLNTGNGGTTRWELMQKMSRTQGDTGWINTDAAVISALSATSVRLAISSVAAIAVKSVRMMVPIGNYDHTITGVAGAKFLYFDDATLVIKQRDSVWDFNTQVPVMVVYWSGTAIIAYPQSELHGIRDTIWHMYEHLYSGAQYKSGLTFTGNVQPDSSTDPNLNTVQYLWSTAGICQDEDIVFTPGTAPWAQTLGSGLTSATAAIFNFLYYNGTSVVSLPAMSDRTPFIHSGAGTVPQFNSGGTMANVSNTNYAVYHFFASPMLGGYSIFSRPHNAQFTSLPLATAARPSDLVWTDISEFKHLYTAIFRVGTGWDSSPAHLCKLVALNDFRLTPGTPNAGVAATDHNSLSNRTVFGSHPATAISLDTTNFNGILSSLEFDPQLAFDKIDDSLFIHDTLTNTFTGTTIATTAYRATQMWTYTGSSAQVFTGFGTLANVFRHNQDMTIVGSDDTNTLTINHNDVEDGWILNGPCELKRGEVIRFLYNGTLARVVEISRSN